jgi:hypothetical protein
MNASARSAFRPPASPLSRAIEERLVKNKIGTCIVRKAAFEVDGRGFASEEVRKIEEEVHGRCVRNGRVQDVLDGEKGLADGVRRGLVIC